MIAPLLRLGAFVGLMAAVLPSQAAPQATADAELWRRECAFAATMADRDLQAFAGFVSEQAVFHSGPTPLKGREAVRSFWQRFYTEAAAPFSWYPDQAELLEPGRLAYTSGPVFGEDGRLIGRFHTIWRKESDGTWRVLLDHGGTPDAKDRERHARPDPEACR
ncbi:nuclear transport factor 2 family protein [Mitsuaria sp. WAJ17]|uniref:YybH family protein n=1 Tax=Mitsuaria sp. WAJ17 TaxID=2761452 RepID=UPI0016040B8B|nr:nuclear transport factor 2 family protein [Mitsuaria sp. WAJ17]MBB2485547.1 nuclear transport factor 2 family protein [Mitsuaria sp. WAJ17]